MDFEGPQSDIVQFFKGKTIFITGGTGFLGKVLIHKLLFICTEVDRIYLLIRAKKGKSSEERLEELLLRSVIFEKLTENPKLRSKLRAVDGDIMQPGLGLAIHQRAELASVVNVIFHSAATVKFNDEVDSALKMNVQGTEELAELAMEMQNLAAFVHVSTAFSHCYRSDIDEKFYPFHLDPLDPAKISPWPNSYTMSKALAENRLSKFEKKLPLAIVRPSIVVGARSEPVPGWVDNFNGPNGMIVGFSTGFLRSVYLDKHSVSDVIPVDVVINLMCAVACHRGMEKMEHIPIFHCTSGSVNPITWGGIKDMGHQSVLDFPYEKNKMYWYPDATYHTYKIFDSIHRIFSNWIPALIMDVSLKLTGKSPVLMKITSRMTNGMAVLEFFATREWKWSNSNSEQLFSTLNETDKKLFNFDISDMNWVAFLRTICRGTRRYLMKQSDNTLEESRKYLKYLHKLDKVCKLVMTFFLFILILFLINIFLF